MFYSLMVLLASALLAVAYQRKAIFVDNISLKRCGFVAKNGSAKFVFFALALFLTLYSGLRSRNNDTSAYIWGYLSIKGNISSLKGIGFGFLDEPGFEIYQVLVKMREIS